MITERCNSTLTQWFNFFIKSSLFFIYLNSSKKIMLIFVLWVTCLHVPYLVPSFHTSSTLTINKSNHHNKYFLDIEQCWIQHDYTTWIFHIFQFISQPCTCDPLCSLAERSIRNKEIASLNPITVIIRKQASKNCAPDW